MQAKESRMPVSKLAIVIALLMSVGCACTSKISYNSPKIIKKATNSVVKISVDYISQDKITFATIEKAYFATGFSIATGDTVSFVLTNRHVCDMEDKANYVLTLQSGEQVKAKFIKSDVFADICLLKTVASIPALTLSKQNASQGDRVLTIGGPDGVFPIIVDGIISGYHNINMKNEPEDDGEFEVHFRAQVMSAPVYPGSSGSPMMNTNGDVVGIVFAVRGEKEHIAFIVPVSEIWRFLDIEEYVHMN